MTFTHLRKGYRFVSGDIICIFAHKNPAVASIQLLRDFLTNAKKVENFTLS